MKKSKKPRVRSPIARDMLLYCKPSKVKAKRGKGSYTRKGRLKPI